MNTRRLSRFSPGCQSRPQSLSPCTCAMLPRVLDSSGMFGETDPQWFGRGIPITGIAGDQQAARLRVAHDERREVGGPGLTGLGGHAEALTPELYDNLVATGFLRQAPDGTTARYRERFTFAMLPAPGLRAEVRAAGFADLQTFTGWHAVAPGRHEGVRLLLVARRPR